MSSINKQLVSLKCVLFLFYAALGCLYPFLSLYVLGLGLTVTESQIISITASCVSILGPLIFGSLADRMAESSTSEKSTKNGQRLRYTIAIVLLLAAVAYGSLLAIPRTERIPYKSIVTSFVCDEHDAFIVQERCRPLTEQLPQPKCYDWHNSKPGTIRLRKCRYACHRPPIGRLANSSTDRTTILTNDSDYDYEQHSDDPAAFAFRATNRDFASVQKRSVSGADRKRTKRDNDGYDLIEPPHLCQRDPVTDTTLCQVFGEYTHELVIRVRLNSSTDENVERSRGVPTVAYDENNIVNEIDDDAGASLCRYPIVGDFQCRINSNLRPDTNDCRPVIACDIPFDDGSMLADSQQCMEVDGDPNLTFWSYLVLRSFGDLFVTAAITLLNAAVVIATRETSSGRSDVGKQFFYAAIGFGAAAPLAAYLDDLNITAIGFAVPFYAFVVFAVLAAVVILCATRMPLSPPEWWWHTKTGLLALPMSTVRKYAAETSALIFVLIALGIFWSALDSNLPLFVWSVIFPGVGDEGDITEMHSKATTMYPGLIAATIPCGVLPALPVLWNAEKLIDYWGHSNLLIVAFVAYIFRFAGLAIVIEPWQILALETLEVFTLFLMWTTAVLYLRHLVPRKFTATGQALAVIAHFCIGRALGTLIGATIDSDRLGDSIRCLFTWLSIAAATTATIYFLAYHCYLKSYCTAAIQVTQARHPITVLQGLGNAKSNGARVDSLDSANATNAYTPLRVYHNSKGRKGQFRY